MTPLTPTAGNPVFWAPNASCRYVAPAYSPPSGWSVGDDSNDGLSMGYPRKTGQRAFDDLLENYTLNRCWPLILFAGDATPVVYSQKIEATGRMSGCPQIKGGYPAFIGVYVDQYGVYHFDDPAAVKLIGVDQDDPNHPYMNLFSLLDTGAVIHNMTLSAPDHIAIFGNQNTIGEVGAVIFEDAAVQIGASGGAKMPVTGKPLRFKKAANFLALSDGPGSAIDFCSGTTGSEQVWHFYNQAGGYSGGTPLSYSEILRCTNGGRIILSKQAFGGVMPTGIKGTVSDASAINTGPTTTGGFLPGDAGWHYGSGHGYAGDIY